MGMGEYGPATALVEHLIERAGLMTLDDAADLYRARVGYLLIWGQEADRRATARAARAAAAAGLEEAFERARRDAVTAWRSALPVTQGPWLVVGQAIGHAAQALVVSTLIDDKTFQQLIGPWRQAMGTSLEPVGPGVTSRQRVRT